MGIIERAVKEAEHSANPASATVSPLPLAEIARKQGQTDESGRPSKEDPKPVVHLDLQKLRDEGRLPAADLVRQNSDEMRRIKWPLLNRIAGRNVEEPARNRVIMVTSAMPGEGKTFISLNLALSIARHRDTQVILVDGDVARPGLTPSFGLEDRQGLNDILEDSGLAVDIAIYRTDVEGLHFVPAGHWHEQSPEFFASSRMRQVLEEFERRIGNCVVILDSPPLLATNEAQVATAYVGQVLMVVRADETERKAVMDAIALVDDSTPVSAVLNNVKTSVLGRYYGQYHYGYGYARQNS